VSNFIVNANTRRARRRAEPALIAPRPIHDDAPEGQAFGGEEEAPVGAPVSAEPARTQEVNRRKPAYQEERDRHAHGREPFPEAFAREIL
jgi:hypothetical protein